MRKGLIPDVYVQDDRFFAPFQNEIRELYGASYEDTQPLDYVSVHVRRGDYVNNDFYVDLFKDGYYERAMAEFPGEKFMVFSDDIEWCKKQDIFKDCEFSDEKDEVKDMNKMIACKAHIICNSSYSWWAAYISGKRTIAPKKWYTLASPHDKEQPIPTTTLPDNWTKL